MPLRVERIATGAESDEWRVAAGRVLAVRLERQREQAEFRIKRGVIALNEPANLPESGVLVLATVPRLDLEAWSSLFGGAESVSKTPTATASGPAIDLFAVRTQELVLMGRTFRNVTLGATRTPTAALTSMSSPTASWVMWLGDRSRSQRLSRLSIAAARKSDVVAALDAPPRELPALDIAAEQFELSDLKTRPPRLAGAERRRDGHVRMARPAL